MLSVKFLGLSGKDDWESAQLDAIADFVKDIMSECRSYLVAAMQNTEEKEELYKTSFKPCMEKSMPILEKFLNESSSGFFSKSGVSWVDFYVANFFESLEGFDKELMDGYRGVLEHKERIYALPQLQKYLETRPKTQF